MRTEVRRVNRSQVYVVEELVMSGYLREKGIWRCGQLLVQKGLEQSFFFNSNLKLESLGKFICFFIYPFIVSIPSFLPPYFPLFQHIKEHCCLAPFPDIMTLIGLSCGTKTQKLKWVPRYCSYGEPGVYDTVLQLFFCMLESLKVI